MWQYQSRFLYFYLHLIVAFLLVNNSHDNNIHATGEVDVFPNGYRNDGKEDSNYRAPFPAQISQSALVEGSIFFRCISGERFPDIMHSLRNFPNNPSGETTAPCCNDVKKLNIDSGLPSLDKTGKLRKVLLNHQLTQPQHHAIIPSPLSTKSPQWDYITQTDCPLYALKGLSFLETLFQITSPPAGNSAFLQFICITGIIAAFYFLKWQVLNDRNFQVASQKESDASLPIHTLLQCRKFKLGMTFSLSCIVGTSLFLAVLVNQSGDVASVMAIRMEEQKNSTPHNNHPYAQHTRATRTCNGRVYYDPYSCGYYATCTDENVCTCHNGYYKVGGDSSTTCYACPYGSWCRNNDKNPCPPGKWVYGTQSDYPSDCTSLCPELYACKNGVMKHCRYGESNEFPLSLLPGQSECGVCPSGMYIPRSPSSSFYEVTIECVSCPQGYVCPGDGRSYPCSGNTYADEIGLASCKTCPPGSHTSADHALCIPCAEEETCPDGEVILTCSPGTYYHFEQDTSTHHCLTCPPGHWCKYGKKFTCDEGYYAESNSTDANSSDPDPFSRSACASCQIGHYCPGDGYEYPCEQEFYADIGGLSKCKTCPVGSYTGNSGVRCSPCLDDGYCPDGEHQYVCGRGEYLSLPDLVCHTCPRGFYCQDLQKFACVGGYYADEQGLIECHSCPEGTYHNLLSQTSRDACEPCPKGTYAPREASIYCIPCGRGKWSNILGSTTEENCFSCPPGSYGPSQGAKSLADCIKCPAGTYNEEYGSFHESSCLQCPIGQYSNAGSTSCLMCEPGSYQDQEGQSSCILCSPGTYNEEYGSQEQSACVKCIGGGSLEYGANSSSVCTDCLPGYFSFNLTCVPCAEGSYSDSVNAHECKLCDAGFYLPYQKATSASECLPCKPGTFANETGQGECSKCPPGSWNNVNASTGNCTQCEVGFFASNEGSTSCTICPIGTYNEREGSPECLPCDLGFYSNITGSSSCSPCEAGRFAEVRGQGECAKCPPGTHSSLTASPSSLNCIKCPKGQYSPSFGATSQKFCIDCSAGFFADSKGQAECTKCPPGTYSIVSGSTSFTTCTSCPRGTYQEREAASSPQFCLPCPRGTYSSVEGVISQSLCLPCPAGFFSDELGVADVSGCKACPPGSYTDTKGASSCTLCPVGSYSNTTAASSAEVCNPCPPTKSTAREGCTSASDCFDCEDGFFMHLSSNVDTTIGYQCRPCPPGSWFDNTTKDSMHLTTKDSCIHCGKGFFQPLEAQTQRETCTQCPKGTFGPLTMNSNCTACGRGFWGDKIGATSKENCTACKVGQWNDMPIAVTPDACRDCPPGSFSNITGAESSTTCRLCEVGHYSQSASAQCIPCENPELCLSPGNSFEIPSEFLLQESSSVHDPNSLRRIILDSYEVLRYSIPFGLFGLLCLCFCCCIGSILGMLRCQYKKFFKTIDWFFSMSHNPPEGSIQIRKPSVLGGVLTLCVLVLFAGLFTSLFITFIGNNKMILESFVLESHAISPPGRFSFEMLIMGVHKECDAIFSHNGFAVNREEHYCKQGLYANPQQDNSLIQACKCVFECTNCSPKGSEQQVTMDLTNHIMSYTLFFTLSVPHYVDGEYYTVNGSMSAGEGSIFAGSDKPHVFSFNMNDARYVSVSNMAPFFDVLGFDIETTTDGYTLSPNGIIKGSSQSTDEEFVLPSRGGMQIVFEIQRMTGMIVSRETLRQNLVSFLANVLTVLSILLAVGSLALNGFNSMRLKYIERSKKKAGPSLRPMARTHHEPSEFTSVMPFSS